LHPSESGDRAAVCRSNKSQEAPPRRQEVKSALASKAGVSRDVGAPSAALEAMVLQIKELLLGLEAVAIGGLLRQAARIEVKGDGELVGELDILVQDAISAHFESDGVRVFGEEGAFQPELLRSGKVILVDPVDGTHNYMLGLPMFGCMCTLLEDGVAAASVIWLPVEQRLEGGGIYVATRGGGAWLHRAESEPIALSVSANSSLAASFVALEGKTQKIARSLAARHLVAASRRARIGLSSCWAGTRVAQGARTLTSLDVLLCVEAKPWDTLPIALLIEEAGGRVTDLSGTPWSLTNCSTLLMTNGHLHAQALDALRCGDAGVAR